MRNRIQNPFNAFLNKADTTQYSIKNVKIDAIAEIDDSKDKKDLDKLMKLTMATYNAMH